MSAWRHPDKRHESTCHRAENQPAPTPGRRPQPTECHEEGCCGDVAAHEGTVFPAFVCRDESRREMAPAAEFLHIDRAGATGMPFKAKVDQEHRPQQCCHQQKPEMETPRPE